MSRDTQKRLTIVAGILLAAIVGLSIATSISYASANSWVDHTLLVQRTATEWEVAVLDAETRVRGYTAAGNPIFVKPWEDALREANEKADALQHLVSDNAVQTRNVATALGDMHSAVDRLREIVALTRTGSLEAAQQLVSSAESKRTVDAFRADVHTIIDEEGTLLSARRDRQSSLAVATFGGSALLVLAAIGFLTLALTSQRRRSEDLSTLAETSRRRLEALGDLATALAATRTRDQVVRVVVDDGLRAMRADTCTLYISNSARTALELIGERGVARAIADRVRRITASSETSATFDTLESGKALWAESSLEYASLFPKLADVDAKGKRARAFWSVPLIVEGKAVGLLGMGYFEERSFPSDERAFIETFARQCGQALVRAQRLETEAEAQQWFETTLHSIGDAVIATDAEGRVTFVNAVAEKLTGWPMAEARGHDLAEVFSIFSEQTRVTVEAPVAKVLREGLVVGLANHTILRSRRGAETPIDDSAAPIRDEHGKLYGVVLVFRDVTEEKRAQVRREFLARAGEALVSSSDYRTTLATVAQFAVPQLADWCAVELVEGDWLRQVAVAHADPGKVAFAREVGERYPTDPNAKTGAPNVIRTGKSELYPDLPAEMLEAGARDADHLRLIRELKLRSAMVVPLRAAGHVLGAMTFIHAESGRHYTEDDLAFAEDFARRAAMAIENAKGMVALDDARVREKELRERAESSNRAKDEFLATVSHELRTPLTAILGWTLMLRGRKLDPEIDRPLSVIERNARAQTQLVEDVLDVSRIISGKLMLTLGPVNVGDVVRAAVETLTPTADAKGVKLLVTTQPETMAITADVNRLQQVLWNLLTNAVKFTPSGGAAHIDARREGDDIVIAVTDTGEGIRKDVLPYVFEPFQQADASATRRHGGLGLGLAIVKHLVTAHAGTITVDSPGEGGGATFTVRLPARSAVPALATTTTREPQLPRLDGLRVLVVDDEDDARMLVGAVLTDRGAEVDAFSSATDALDKVQSLHPDVIVSDIAMPSMDGYTFIRKIRALPPATGRTPALALTAYARLEDSQLAFAAGFQMHVAKPIEPARLVTMVANLGGRTQD